MKRTLLIAATALALSAPAVPHAHAVEWNSTGQWLDTRRHIVADDAHLGYAKAVCHAREGTWTGGPAGPGYGPCMKAQGFAFIFDTPAQIAARERVAQGERNVVAAHMFGQALIGIANDLNRPQPQPQHCNGFIYRGGDINMNCN